MVNGQSQLQPGGAYEVTIRPEAQATQSFYCHRHDPDASPHTLVLNFEIDKAKFSELNRTLFTQGATPGCTGCHASGPAPQLSNYTTYSSRAGGGDPYRSLLYDSIVNNRMPIQGTTPVPFSADQKRLIWDWIVLGAQNN